MAQGEERRQGRKQCICFTHSQVFTESLLPRILRAAWSNRQPPGLVESMFWGGEDSAPGGRRCGGRGLEAGGAATRTAVPVVPSPTERSPTQMSSRNHLTGAASLHQWETTGQSAANNASLALEAKCPIWHLTRCILNSCSWICLCSRKR